jgi:acyl carrier protein
VTGGSRGIGRAIAELLAARGAAVAVSFRDREDAARGVVETLVARSARALALRCDVADEAQVQSMFAGVTNSLGAVDILVNNAGIAKDGLLLMMDRSSWDPVLRVNLDGAYTACAPRCVPCSCGAGGASSTRAGDRRGWRPLVGCALRARGPNGPFIRGSCPMGRASAARTPIDMTHDALKVQIKQAIVRSLKLPMTPDDIEDAAPLFGEGLGLDSIDALELVLELERSFGVVIGDEQTGGKVLRSIDSIAEFVAQQRKTASRGW